MDKLSASLSAADAHVVVMGNAMLGLVHPCKVYNIFAVGAPVIYIGPTPSHVTEAVTTAGVKTAFISVRHGEAEQLAKELLQLKKIPTEARHASHAEYFSAAHLLPRLVAAVENVNPPTG